MRRKVEKKRKETRKIPNTRIGDLKKDGDTTAGEQNTFSDNLLHCLGLPIWIKELLGRNSGHEIILRFLFGDVLGVV